LNCASDARKFALELHPDKTKVLAFGRYADERRRRRKQSGATATFDFLGLTHICSVTREGMFALVRHTMRKRMTAKLRTIGTELRRRRHESVPAQGRWLSAVLRGHYNYYSVPTNIKALGMFRYALTLRWYRSLRRRSQRSRLNWTRMNALATRWLPQPHISHPWPGHRFDARTHGKSPVR